MKPITRIKTILVGASLLASLAAVEAGWLPLVRYGAAPPPVVTAKGNCAIMPGMPQACSDTVAFIPSPMQF